MSLNAMGGGGLPREIDPKFIKADPDGAALLLPMGITSENVVSKYGISRAEQVRPSHRPVVLWVALWSLSCAACLWCRAFVIS